MSRAISLKKRKENVGYIRSLVKSMMNIIRNLETNSILASSWTDAVREGNKIFPDLSSAISNCSSYKDKAIVLVRFKLQRIITSLKNSLKTISNEKITQALVKSTLGELRKEVSSAFVPYLSMLILKFITQMLTLSKDYFAASESSNAWFTIADLFFDTREMLFAIEVCGKCLRDRRMYSDSIECFRKQLFLSWILNDVSSEIRSYDSLGLSYYYMNDLEKATKYHKKAVNADTELEDSELHKQSLSKFNQNKKKRSIFMVKKNQFYRYNFMKNILDDDTYLKEESHAIELSHIQCNFSMYDESSMKYVKEETNPASFRKGHRRGKLSDSFKDLRPQQFKCSFSKEGLMHSLSLSNPIKFDLIKKGFIEIDPKMLKDIDLRTKNSARNISSILLTHQSQNKSAESFINYQNFRGNESEVCLEYIEPEIKQKFQNKINEYLTLFDLLLNNMPI